MSYFAIVPKIGGFGNRTTLLRRTPEGGCGFIMAQIKDTKRPMEEEAVALLYTMGAVSLKDHDGEYLFDRLGFTLSVDTDDALPLIHWLMVDDLPGTDIANMIKKNTSMYSKHGKLEQKSISGLEMELRLSSNKRVGAALQKILMHNNDHIIQKEGERSLIAHLR